MFDLLFAAWVLVALAVLFIANILKKVIVDICESESFYKCFKPCFKQGKIIPVPHATITRLPVNTPVSTVETLQVTVVADLN